MPADKSGFRLKSDAGLSLMYRGGKHVGNIVHPSLGGDKNKAQKFMAISKHWGKKSNHDSLASARDWLKNKHMSSMSIKMNEDEVVGATPYSKAQAKEKRSMINIIKKDGTKAINPKPPDDNVVEAFLRVYSEAKAKANTANTSKDEIVFDPTMKDPDPTQDAGSFDAKNKPLV